MTNFNDDLYESLVREGISAAKVGYRDQARKLLERAVRIKQTDARPWLWLSATTSDPVEQREFLGRAVAADPSNAAARRGLLELSGKLDKESVLPMGEGVAPRRPAEAEEAQAEAYTCPNCGGQLSFSVSAQALVCNHCGSFQENGTAAEAQGGESIDVALLTTRGHRWAEAQQRVACERCGAVSLLPPGQKADQCPYCGSNRLVEAAEAGELLDPQAVAVMKLDQAGVARAIKAWLGKGFFPPDDLALKAGGLKLRPAYYSFWAFSGTVGLPYHCEVNEGTSKNPRWVTVKGTETEFFDDVLVSGVKALADSDVSRVEPFDLQDLVEFKPDYLVGWTALTYDISMADASLTARERVIRAFHRKIRSQVAAGQTKRDFSTGVGQWSGQTFRHVLLPLWVGAYTYQGKVYRLVVNGQTGKVGGVKPRDNVKVFMVAVGGVMVGIMLAILLFWFWQAFGAENIR